MVLVIKNGQDIEKKKTLFSKVITVIEKIINILGKIVDFVTKVLKAINVFRTFKKDD